MQDTKESGMLRQIKEMAKDSKFGQMDLFMKGTGKTIRLMEEVV